VVGDPKTEKTTCELHVKSIHDTLKELQNKKNKN
jgi:hypothetical protein